MKKGVRVGCDQGGVDARFFFPILDSFSWWFLSFSGLLSLSFTSRKEIIKMNTMSTFAVCFCGISGCSANRKRGRKAGGGLQEFDVIEVFRTPGKVMCMQVPTSIFK
jgi:hypothetical protein